MEPSDVMGSKPDSAVFPPPLLFFLLSIKICVGCRYRVLAGCWQGAGPGLTPFRVHFVGSQRVKCDARAPPSAEVSRQ